MKLYWQWCHYGKVRPCAEDTESQPGDDGSARKRLIREVKLRCGGQEDLHSDPESGPRVCSEEEHKARSRRCQKECEYAGLGIVVSLMERQDSQLGDPISATSEADPFYVDSICHSDRIWKRRPPK